MNLDIRMQIVGSAYYKLHIGERKNNEDNVIKSVEEQRKMKKEQCRYYFYRQFAFGQAL